MIMHGRLETLDNQLSREQKFSFSQSSGSRLDTILPPREHLAMSGDLFDGRMLSV